MIQELTAHEPAIKVVAMPKDANADGDIFGGWILSMMDLAGGIVAKKIVRSRVVTVAVNNMVFHLPVFIGDCVKCYASFERVGTTSITLNVEAYVERAINGKEEKVTEGQFVFVAIDAVTREPIKIPMPLMLTE